MDPVWKKTFGNDLCTKCSWALLNWESNARAVCALLLVDTAVNTLVVSKALKVPSPGLQDKSDDSPSVEDESYDHEADVSPNAWPSEDGRQNCDLQEARSLYDELKTKISRGRQCSRINGLLQEQGDLMKGTSTAFFTVAAIPRYGRNHPHFHKDKTNQQLETSSSSSVRNASLSSYCKA